MSHRVASSGKKAHCTLMMKTMIMMMKMSLDVSSVFQQLCFQGKTTSGLDTGLHNNITELLST